MLIRDRVHSGLRPFGMVSIRDGVHSELCFFGSCRGSRFYWPKIRCQILPFSRGCHSCQKAKVLVILSRHGKAPPDGKFAFLQCDIVGPLPPTPVGFQYRLTIIDRFTRHLEVAPLKEISAKTCANAFLLNWVARFGCPIELTCDRGAQFISNPCGIG